MTSNTEQLLEKAASLIFQKHLSHCLALKINCDCANDAIALLRLKDGFVEDIVKFLDEQKSKYAFGMGYTESTWKLVTNLIKARF